MPTLTINEEQVLSLIEQLSSEQKEQIFQILLFSIKSGIKTRAIYRLYSFNFFSINFKS